jgi:hypothetical protein
MTALDAWTLCLSLSAQHRHAPPVIHDDPATNARIRQTLMAIGGMMVVADSNDYSRGAIQRQFVAAWSA